MCHDEPTFVGLDGCPGGWIAAILSGERLHFMELARIGELPGSVAPAAIGVDIPIGLEQGRPRRCDIEARQMLGRKRSSVFPSPDRRLLHLKTYEEANSLNRDLNGKGLSRQTFNIMSKIQEADEFARRGGVPLFEVHPELVFARLAGGPLDHNKKRPEGFTERHALLSARLPPGSLPERKPIGRARPDDWIDAVAVVLAARRIFQGEASRLPDEEVRDAEGLLMAIHF